MKYDIELNKKILENCDLDYASFHGALVPTTKIRGVRIPVLRQIAKHFSVYDDFLENITLDNYESICVACYYIGITTKDLKTLENRLDFILPYIDNWATCDTFASSLKILKTKKDEFFDTLCSYLLSKNDFTVRFAIVCFLNFYIQEDKIEDLLNKMINLQNRSYYLDMAIAWFVSVAFVKCRNQTLKFLKSKVLTKEVQNKCISKICDSFRVSKEDKEFVKKLKKID